MRNAISAEDLHRFDEVANLHDRPGQRLSNAETLAKLMSECSSLSQAISQIDADARPVRAVAFNKSDSANWGVPWHQDRVIALAERHDVSGYGNWSRKSGTWHCEPPLSFLQQMLFVRVHLDPSTEDNGAMQIAVGSHRAGLVSASQAEQEAHLHPIETCEAERGDVLILKMLILHASKPATVPSSRRAVRLDYSTAQPKAPLNWA
ncbi:MAG: phytanoyl-CoA dioxygenase family protein [Pseudomonadota bacterium]